MAEMSGLMDLNQLSSILREVGVLVGRGTAVEKEVDKFIKKFLPFQLVLDDALNMQLNDGAARVPITTVKDTLSDIDDALDEWNTAVKKGAEDDLRPIIRKVCSFIPSYLQCHYKHLVLRRDIAFKIKSLNKTLEYITEEKHKFNFSMLKGIEGKLERERSPSFLDQLEVYGRAAENNKLLELLLSESSQGPSLPVISIVGSGGIGKTSLARLVFNDTEVKTHFNKRIWVSASYPCEEIWIAKAILKSLREFDASDLVELETVLRHIGRFIRGKKFLLVLDNIKIGDLKSWEQLNYYLKCGCQGSRILVTALEENAVKKKEKTREENAVAEKGKTHEENAVMEIETTFTITLRTLTKEDYWSLFCQLAFHNREQCENLEEIGRNIVDKCNGLPIAVKILGSLLSLKRNVEDWKNVLHGEISELAEEKGLFPPLLLSYYDLPIILRKCFSYCAIFPKNYEIEKSRLIKLWMSQNYLKAEGREDMELIGEEYFENLVMLSFFQDFQRNTYNGSIISCKMHDIVYDFAQFIAKNECFIMEVNDSAKSKSESSYEKVPHLMIIFEREGSFPVPVYNDRELRSLVVEPRGGFMSDVDLGKLFDRLTCLRTLDLSNHDNAWYDLIKEVPKGIKMFIHLRYLNLSKNRKIKDLPETLCELYNLQTLELQLCTNLKNLPQGIGKLINLRHLVNDETSISCMPKGVRRLASLRTLSEFIVTLMRTYPDLLLTHTQILTPEVINGSL
ncbi:disease resistance protein RGA2-like [Pistacia vera]|uniref:disease resistance protein RGA2-like n=1 Tax=Pistacia vera TaxID=55513 RepID=UPI0012634C9C|nr:disease resistance protein RGA2-like [Pistacia vera]